MKLRIAGCLAALLAVALLAGAEAAVTPLTIDIEAKISPQTIVMSSDTTWLTVHTDIKRSQVATYTLDLSGIEIEWTTVDAHGNLVAKFDMDLVKGIVSAPSATLTLSGFTNDGIYFEGSDTVQVVRGKK